MESTTKDNPDQKENQEPKNEIKIPDFVCFDFEWNEKKEITIASFVDSSGFETSFAHSEFSEQREFLIKILKIISKYKISIGYSSTNENSDLDILQRNCEKYAINNPIYFKEIRKKGVRGYKKLYFIRFSQHIDLYNIFGKGIVKSIFGGVYRGLGLDEVSKSLLGKGKYLNLNGADVQFQDIEVQKQYCLHDTRLTYELAMIKNGELLQFFLYISYLLKMPFEKVCNSPLSVYWQKILDDQGAEKYYNPNFRKESNYRGANVINPKPGAYQNVKLVDVASLYPKMVVNFNISFDTINCTCCPGNIIALPSDIIDKNYNICTKKQGIFSKKQKEFMDLRLDYKIKGDRVRANGLKILINGGYGVFGSEFFKYSDFRVAELVSATGRYTLDKMVEIAKEFGFEIIYGDTDSLFLKGEDIYKFQMECKRRLDILVEFEKEFKKFIVTKKKHYVGIDTKNNIVIKGYEGKKSDRPRWINRTFDRFVEDVMHDKDPVPQLEEALEKLYNDSLSGGDLQFSAKLTKNPLFYDKNVFQKKLGKMVDAKEGDVIKYFKSKKGETLDYKNIDKNKYKDALFDSGIGDILDVINLPSVPVHLKRSRPDKEQRTLDLFILDK